MRAGSRARERGVGDATVLTPPEEVAEERRASTALPPPSTAAAAAASEERSSAAAALLAAAAAVAGGTTSKELELGAREWLAEGAALTEGLGFARSEGVARLSPSMKIAGWPAAEGNCSCEEGWGLALFALAALAAAVAEVDPFAE